MGISLIKVESVKGIKMSCNYREWLIKRQQEIVGEVSNVLGLPFALTEEQIELWYKDGGELIYNKPKEEKMWAVSDDAIKMLRKFADGNMGLISFNALWASLEPIEKGA